MKLSAILLLGILLGTLPARTASANEIGRAPAVPFWPEGLPDAEIRDDGTHVVPAVLADAIHDRLLHLDSYPSRCQAHLDALDRVLGAEKEGALSICRADCRMIVTMAAAEPRGGAVWPLALVGILGAVLGISGALFIGGAI